ncbi:uncharacterized protein LOC128390127 [Panonychus citri]|uniref:uncharacterized protein LOC128390127 n=1 Tax=Panonychus citri TaxID=50023 RepID=UPI002307CF7E|nr:uncharacterized protein LOC128390127 [Panonychus citri]
MDNTKRSPKKGKKRSNELDKLLASGPVQKKSNVTYDSENEEEETGITFEQLMASLKRLDVDEDQIFREWSKSLDPITITETLEMLRHYLEITPHQDIGNEDLSLLSLFLKQSGHKANTKHKSTTEVNLIDPAKVTIRDREGQNIFLSYRTKTAKPKNWLDVTNLPIKPSIIVQINDKNDSTKLDGFTTKKTFSEIYEESGENHLLIEKIIPQQNGIKIILETEEARKVLMQELQSIKKDNWQVLIPNLRDPKICFITSNEISESNAAAWMLKLKRYNRWADKHEIKWQSTTTLREGKYKITLSINSTLRNEIERLGGKISVGYQKEEIFDRLNLIVCLNCSQWNHRATNCKYKRSCGYCGEAHPGKCEITLKSDWKCPNCKKKGHSAFCHECPLLLIKLQNEMEKINHQYTNLFLENFY